MALISFDLTAKTFEGLEQVLANELRLLGAENIELGRRVVHFRGNQELMYRANLELRTALRILKPIHQFRATTADELYQGVRQLRWSRYFETAQTFAIDAVVRSEHFEHSQFAALRAKDAIVDQFREAFGIRPTVDTEAPQILINLHIHQDAVTVSLDSSGEPLFKRGYRVRSVEAPLNEVMAAGLLQLAEWDADTPLMDPMCGSGTLPIEAALLATNTPSQILRKSFAFQNWKDYDDRLWLAVRKQAMQRRVEINFDILASDIDPQAIEATQANLQTAGLTRVVQLRQASFFDLEDPLGFGFLICNPPYGQRLDPEPMTVLYPRMGTTLKHHFAGWDAWIFSGNPEAMKYFGLHPKRKIPLLNAAIESTFQHFELYSGTKNV